MMLPRKRPLIALAAGLAVGGFGFWAAGCGSPTPPPPGGLLLITLDTIRADRLGAYGCTEVETPFVDGLAARGVVFDRAVAPVPLTLPSHTSLFTGTFPPRHGVRDNGDFVVPEELTTLAELFQARGHRTAAFVGAFVLDRRWGLNQGFEHYSDEFDIGSPAELLSIGDVQRPANEVVDEALAWLGGLGQEPFFAWVHLFDPHDPYDPPSPYREQYSGRPYLGEVAFSDAQLMRLEAWLRASGRSNDTMIVFAGDHGEAFGEHGESGHGFFLYQETIRVPLIVVDPTTDQHGVWSSEPVSLVDLYPTVCERFGIEIPATSQGRSLLPLLGGRGTWDARPVYSETYSPYFHYGWSPLSSIQDIRYQYIDSSEPELYDLEADPDQFRDVAAADPDVLRHLKGQHDLLIEEMGLGSSVSKASVDAETVAKLAALGYVSGTTAPAPPTQRANLTSPRSRISVYNLLQEARGALAAGDLERAESALDEALAVDPDVAETHSQLGTLRMRQRRTAEAAAMFERGLDLKQDDMALIIKLATARLGLGLPDQALDVIERAAEHRPNETWPVLLLASFARQAGRAEVAQAALERTLTIDPDSAAAHLEMAVLALGRGDHSRVQAAATRALELDPRLRGAHLCLAQSLEAEGKLEAALAEFQAERDLSPRDYRVVYGLARLYGRLGNSDEETALLHETIHLEPNFPPAYLFLARNLMLAGERYSEAIELVEEALAREPRGADLVLSYYLLADLYSRTGDDTRSRQYAAQGKRAQDALAARRAGDATR